jgi:predicted amino acid-binding ACT domain protein
MCSFNDLQERLASDSEKLGMQINLQREDVFTFMYKV